MKLYRLLSSGLVLAILSTFILPLSSVAAGGSNRAGASSSTTPGGAVTSADKFFERLVSDHFQQMGQMTRGNPNFHPYPTVPFLNGMPVFAPTADVEVAGQALRDYGSILVVDPNKDEGFKVHIAGQYLGKGAIEELDLEKAQLLLNLPEGAHILQKHFARERITSTYPIPLPRAEKVNHLPHFNGMPIIIAGSESDTLGHMRTAANTGPFGFYYAKRGHKTVLVLPRDNENLGYISSKQTLAEIEATMPKFQKVKNSFGVELASILYGPSIPVDSRMQKPRERWRGPPRFTPGGNYEAMTKSLQEYGQFHFDVPNRRDTHSFVVKVLNFNDPDETPMEIEMSPLRATEEMGKSLLSEAARAHPPV
ncbi:uncharacterized protein UTRI_04534 [Ustilago trichophora]|uniref:Effector family protein Eff1 n=1 Tax=Ustilago trichophora TaxID=86804 RepID=A0A5C3EGC6_9BASI|nr:uncharacterized protein UTRI_04534 [Ustilago trichophora]